MVHKSTKLRMSTLVINMTCLLIINSPYIGQRYTNMIRLIMEMIILFFMLFRFKVYKKVNTGCVSILLYVVASIVSTLLSYGLSSRFLNALVTGVMYFIFFYVLLFFSEKYSYIYVIKQVKNMLVILMLILDFFVFITLGKGLEGRGIGGVQIEEAVYLLANKFTTAYLHMAVLALLEIKSEAKNNRRSILRIIAFTVYSILICSLTDTTTGMVGCISTALLKIGYINHKKLLSNIRWPIVVLSVFLGANAIFLCSDLVLSNPKLTAFFLSRSHTGTILSGRVQMFRVAIEAIGKRLVWGYGINCEIVKNTLSFGNAQNGLLKLLLDFGCVGTITFCLMLYCVFKCVIRERNNVIVQGCTAFIYAMLICSLVEVNLAAVFLLMCALMNAATRKSMEEVQDEDKMAA